MAEGISRGSSRHLSFEVLSIECMEIVNMGKSRVHNWIIPLYMLYYWYLWEHNIFAYLALLSSACFYANGTVAVTTREMYEYPLMYIPINVLIHVSGYAGLWHRKCERCILIASISRTVVHFFKYSWWSNYALPSLRAYMCTYIHV